MANESFEFFRENRDSDGALAMVLTECEPADSSIFKVPGCLFEMRPAHAGAYMGRIRLRSGWNEESIRYAGQVGYAVEPGFHLRWNLQS